MYTTKVQYIVENDVTDLGLVFAEEEFESNRGTPTVSSYILHNSCLCSISVVEYSVYRDTENSEN